MRSYHNNKSLPQNWRSQLPSPIEYYSNHIERLRGSGVWLQGLCPFHEDRNPSFSINSHSGYWICFAGCGKGDMINFHKLLTGSTFKEAVLQLLEMS